MRLLGGFVSFLLLIASLVALAAVNVWTTPRFLYEFLVEALVDGEPVTLRTGRICEPGWEMGIPIGRPMGYQGYDFSVGSELASGGGIFARVPDYCRYPFPNNPLASDWGKMALEEPIAVEFETLTLYRTNDFEKPWEFIFPDPRTGNRNGSLGIELVRAEWRPLAVHEFDSVPAPRIRRYGRHPTVAQSRLRGAVLDPVSAESRHRGTLVWQDPSGRYEIYNLPNSSLAASASEPLRGAIPLRATSEGSIGLGTPGEALYYAYPAPARFGDNLIIFQGVAVRVERYVGLYDRSTDTFFEFRLRAVPDHVVPLRDAFQL